MALSIDDLRYAFYGHTSSLADAEFAFMLAAYNAGVTASGIVGGGYVSAGSPESSIAAPVGAICRDTTNGVIYVKHTGTGNTGWKLVTQAA